MTVTFNVDAHYFV